MLCSCLIAHNLLPGFKTCLEVARYMLASGESMPHESIPSSITDINDKINAEYIVRISNIHFLIFSMFYFIVLILFFRWGGRSGLMMMEN